MAYSPGAVDENSSTPQGAGGKIKGVSDFLYRFGFKLVAYSCIAAASAVTPLPIGEVVQEVAIKLSVTSALGGALSYATGGKSFIPQFDEQKMDPKGPFYLAKRLWNTATSARVLVGLPIFAAITACTGGTAAIFAWPFVLKFAAVSLVADMVVDAKNHPNPSLHKPTHGGRE